MTGLSGLGDLMLTCAGPASRNYSLGFELGRGERPALAARAVAAVADQPICAAVAGVITGRLSVVHAMDALLSRPRQDE